MCKSIIITGVTITLLFTGVNPSQSQSGYKLSKPVITELDRLDEAYNLLDQFADKVWTGWNDYMDFPFLMSFQNGLRVLIGHPNPPQGFILYPQLMVHDLSVYIDTSNLNTFEVRQPLVCGGGIIPYGTNTNNEPVTIVNLSFNNVSGGKVEAVGYGTSEEHILVFIHELMHCYQDKILPQKYGNLNMNPDLNHAFYSEIEGVALSRAFKSDSPEKALPFLKDFCVARSLKFQGLSEYKKGAARCDEFREGEAVYSEVTILQNIRNGYKSVLTTDMDPGYHQFADIDKYLDKYVKRLGNSAGQTLEIYQKNYDYGCFEALMLQKYFPGWQKEIEAGSWLDPVLRNKLAMTEADSLESLRRFSEVYQIEQLKEKHGKIINGRNETYRQFVSRTGKVYVISFKPIKEYLPSLADKSKPTYKLGLMEMFPEGIGSLKFDSIVLDIKPVPTEINQLYHLKVVDTDPVKKNKPYTVTYQSIDESGVYTHVTITTPLFMLKAPRVSIRERGKRIKIMVHSRI